MIIQTLQENKCKRHIYFVKHERLTEIGTIHNQGLPQKYPCPESGGRGKIEFSSTQWEALRICRGRRPQWGANSLKGTLQLETKTSVQPAASLTLQHWVVHGGYCGASLLPASRWKPGVPAGCDPCAHSLWGSRMQGGVHVVTCLGPGSQRQLLLLLPAALARFSAVSRAAALGAGWRRPRQRWVSGSGTAAAGALCSCSSSPCPLGPQQPLPGCWA